MKNILVVLVLLAVSQMMLALDQKADPLLNGPNDCGTYTNPLVETVFISSRPTGGSKCGEQLEEAKKHNTIEPEETPNFEESKDERLCCDKEEEKADRNKKMIRRR